MMFYFCVLQQNFGKIPAFLKRKYKAEEAAKLAEEERLRSIKPPYRLLSDDERDDLLKVSKRTIHPYDFSTYPLKFSCILLFAYNRQ